MSLINDIDQLEELNFYLSDNISPCINMAYSLDGLGPDVNSYECIPVTQWNSLNCVDWGMSICEKYNFGDFTVDVGRLNNSSGTHLIQSSESDFCFILGDQYGPIFYSEFQQLKRDLYTDIQNRHTNSEEGHGVDQNRYYYDHMGYSPDSEAYISNSEGYDSSQDGFNSSMYESSQDGFNSNTYDYSQDGHNSSTCDSNQVNYGYSQNHYDPSLDSYISPVLTSSSPDQHSEMWNLEKESLDNIQIASLDAQLPNGEIYHNSEKKPSIKTTKTPSSTKERKSRKKDIKEVYVSDDTAHKVTGKIPGLSNRVRQPKCWEFLMHLLVNPETNPEVVRWEDEENYIFRLVRKDKIVELWGKKSEFTSHVYDNFARSLRYHYKSSILLPVPEKQLVYRCGPKAIEYINKIKSS